MIRFSLGLSLLVGMGLGMLGCGDSGDSNPCPSGEVECDGVCIDAIDPTLESIQVGIFNGSCAASSCHDSNLPQANLNLSDVAASAAGLIDVESEQVDGLRVAPGDAASSYVMNKLLGVGIPQPYLRMPVGGVLCEEKINVVRQWIDDGAPMN